MAGSILINPAMTPIQVIGKRAPLADAAAAPRYTATATAAAPATAAAASAASPASAAAATASAAAAAAPATSIGDLHARFRGRGIFLVEDIERRQADVREFFFAQRDFVARCNLLQRHVRSGRAGRGRCDADSAG